MRNRGGSAKAFVALVSVAAIIAAVTPALSASSGTPNNLQAHLILLRDNWRLQTTVLAGENGEPISLPEFKTEGWHAATVPTTVLNALVREGVYPDPYVGMNNMRIPDASDEFNRRYGLAKFSHLAGGRNPWSDPWWFRTSFALPEDFRGRSVWLTFEGINYRAEIWMNGKKIAGSNEVIGMFGRWTFDITGAAAPGAENILAVKVFPLDFPGLPGEPQLKAFGPFGLNGGPTGDIGKNVTMHCSVGWDWMPAVRDRNMGIWQDVAISATGPVVIRDPQVVTDLPLPDVATADIVVKADICNVSDTPQEGTLTLRIFPPAPGAMPLAVAARKVSLAARSTSNVRFSPDTEAGLKVKNPDLWWPNGLGRPALHRLELDCEIAGSVSASERIPFGIREFSSRTETVDGWARREFLVNGVRIPVRGAAWVPDMMLNHTPERLRAELSLWREVNLNLVRIWGGGTTPSAAFFDLCDELGLLVWHDFWITGDCQGTWDKGSPDYPYDARAFLKNAADTVKKLRNHASLLVWTAGNEGYPREDIYRPLRDDLVAGLDGTRPFLPSSGYREPPKERGLSWPDNGPAGSYSGGPYHWVDPAEYGRLVAAGKDWLYKNETGIPSVPVLESLGEFLPPEPDPAVKFPLNDAWGYHDACEDNGKYSLYDQAIRGRYGEPTSLAEYARKAQLVNAESYRALFEAVNQAGPKTSGVMLWKGNPAWPSVGWQIYDWYLRPHAGYYFIKKACEPLHIQLDTADGSAWVVNTTREDRRGLEARVRIYDPAFKLTREMEATIDVPAASVREVPVSFTRQLASPASAQQPAQPAQGNSSAGLLPPGGAGFAALRLYEKGKLVSDNFYWLSPDGRFGFLDALPKADLEVTAKHGLVDGKPGVRVRLRNGGKAPAFFVHLRVVKDGKEILPSFWSDDFLTLLPGESREVTWSSLEDVPAKESPRIEVEGWNISAQDVAVR